jgi:hypothetical protein
VQAGRPTQAAAGADFKQWSALLTFNRGVVVKYVPVTVYGDERDESDETVTVTHSDVVGASEGIVQTTVTIRDDDDGSTPGTVASAGDVSIHEGDTKAPRRRAAPLPFR